MEPELRPTDALTAAVDACTGERERALLTEGMWADPAPVPCINCGGPLVRVERITNRNHWAGEITVSYMEAYYRLGAAFGADVLYKCHDQHRCWRERLRQEHHRRGFTPT